MNRRDLITAAASLPFMGGVASATVELSPIQELYREWRGHYERSAAAPADCPTGDAELEAAYEIEPHMTLEKCESATDVLALLAMWSRWGEMGLDDRVESPEMWAEVERFIGA